MVGGTDVRANDSGKCNQSPGLQGNTLPQMQLKEASRFEHPVHLWKVSKSDLVVGHIAQHVIGEAKVKIAIGEAR